MDAIAILGIAVLCGVIYLIGHAHGKSATTTVVLGGAGAGTPAAPATDPNNNPQIKN